ncbi:MAG: glycosyltransferase family 39 protein [Acidobacteriota bacterium]
MILKLKNFLNDFLAKPEQSETKGQIIKDQSYTNKEFISYLSILFTLCLVAFFFAASRFALLGPDEPRYAEVAREMFVSGEYISTRLCGCLWFEKPALVYWMIAASYHLFGVSEFAARFPAGLSATLATLTIFCTLTRTVSLKWAMGAGLMLLTSGIFIGYAHAATPDMVLTATMSVAILTTYVATSNFVRSRFWLMTLSFAAIGLAFMAKGLVGIVLTFGILFLFLWLTGRWRLLRINYLMIGLLVFFAVSATWYLPVTLKHGWHFIDEFFIQHHFQRYIKDVFGHPQPIYFFAVIAFVGVLPWSGFFIPAIVRLKNLRPRIDEENSLLTLAWIWALIPLLFFSLSESKLPGYILPVFPALAIILGKSFADYWTKPATGLLKITAWLTAILLVSLSVGFVGYLRTIPISSSPITLIIAAIPIGLALIGVVGLALGKKAYLLFTSIAVILGLIISAGIILPPYLNESVSLKRLSLDAAESLNADEKIAYYILKDFAAVFYAEGRVVCKNGEILNALKEDALIEELKSHHRLIIITRERWLTGLKNRPEIQMEPISQQGEYYALRVQLQKEKP